ncbi:MAG: 3-phosphoshikimate 1-carboxyvinyltransferase, partial [Methanobacterium sp.]|nr:3-phosphoshikimate 1-carboxyvinyltransferase [Methanobacterium sp.]
MKLIVEKSQNIAGEIKAPPSKSYTHRAIIISALATGNSLLKYP